MMTGVDVEGVNGRALVSSSIVVDLRVGREPGSE
jgi:hypothetical protein